MICGPDELGWTGGNPAQAVILPKGLEPGAAVPPEDSPLLASPVQASAPKEAAPKEAPKAAAADAPKDDFDSILAEFDAMPDGGIGTTKKGKKGKKGAAAKQKDDEDFDAVLAEVGEAEDAPKKPKKTLADWKRENEEQMKSANAAFDLSGLMGALEEGKNNEEPEAAKAAPEAEAAADDGQN